MDDNLTTVRTEDDAELAVWSSGPAQAEAIMLVHGFSLDHTTWQPVAAQLVSKGYRVITADQRGHGRSTLGTASPTADRLVADVARIIADLDLRAVHLVGHSLGAVVALAARTNAATAGSIASITSVSGTEQSIQNPVMRAGAYLFSSPLGIWALGRKRLGRLVISSWFGKSPDPEQLDWIRTLSASCARDTRDTIAKATGDLDLRPSFALPGPPTLVVCGRKDQATPLKVSKRIAAAIDGATLVPIDDAGHMVIIERSGVLGDALTGWIEQLH